MKPMLKIKQDDQRATTQQRSRNNKLVLIDSTTAPARTATATLEIKVSNVKSAKGQVMVAIYDKATNFNKLMLLGTGKSAKKGEVSFSFPELPLGNYAVMVFHDLNKNGRLDTDSFGMPTEPWGASLQGQEIFGAPSWSDTKFDLPQSGLTVLIPLR